MPARSSHSPQGPKRGLQRGSLHKSRMISVGEQDDSVEALVGLGAASVNLYSSLLVFVSAILASRRICPWFSWRRAARGDKSATGVLVASFSDTFRQQQLEGN